MTQIGNDFFKKVTGYTAAAVDSSEFVGAVEAENWWGVMYVVSVGSIGTSLDITVQDSADGTTYADLSGQTISAEATTDYVILVRHSQVRPFVRIHLEGADDPVASVVVLRLKDQGGKNVGGDVDLLI